MQTHSAKVPTLRYCFWSWQAEGLQTTQRSLVISPLQLVCAINHITFNWRRKKWEPLLSDDHEELFTTKPLLQESSPLHTASCLCLGQQNEVEPVHFWAVHYCVCRVAIPLFHIVLPSLLSPICKFGILFPVPTGILWAIKLENIHTQRWRPESD